MFVATFKWNKKIAMLIVIAVAVILCLTILAIGSGSKNSASAASHKVETNEDRIMFLEDLGWEVEASPLSQKEIIIPKEFSAVYESYNKLQQAQGYDLSEYCGLEAIIYTYTVTNYSGYTGNVVADLYVRNSQVIGGDIHSLAVDGFMHGLSRK